ncbi:MAG: hypothetical protein M3040_04205, partial [Bacteroidota bacterium]|nr:hypothetical protein [Bacteroidota bacterium]
MVDLSNKGVWLDAKGRREFVSTLLKAAAGSGLLMLPVAGIASKASAASFTVQQIIDLILKDIPGA